MLVLSTISNPFDSLPFIHCRDWMNENYIFQVVPCQKAYKYSLDSGEIEAILFRGSGLGRVNLRWDFLQQLPYFLSSLSPQGGRATRIIDFGPFHLPDFRMKARSFRFSFSDSESWWYLLWLSPLKSFQKFINTYFLVLNAFSFKYLNCFLFSWLSLDCVQKQDLIHFCIFYNSQQIFVDGVQQDDGRDLLYI